MITLKPRNLKEIKDNGVPGPGFYKLRALINGTGEQWNSKYKSHLPKVIISPKVNKSLYDNGTLKVNRRTRTWLLQQ